MATKPQVVGRIGNFEIERVYDMSEPNVCARAHICNELHNGLTQYSIDFGGGFILAMWLCSNCVTVFEKYLKVAGLK